MKEIIEKFKELIQFLKDENTSLENKESTILSYSYHIAIVVSFKRTYSVVEWS